MSNYLAHMNKLGGRTAFARRKEYLAYNFKLYLSRLTTSSRVLEIGPGIGEMISLLNEHNITKIDLIDNDNEVLKYCQANYKINKTILSKSLDLTKSVAGKYDLIVLTQVFEHIPKTAYQNWIKTLYKALNPGGSILITVPNGSNPLSGTERYGDLQHENMFNIYSLSELMTFANLKDATYKVVGFKIPTNTIVGIIRRLLQKILHGIFILLMIINGAIFQTLLTPNITLIITKKK